MGTSGFVGQIGTFKSMGFSIEVLFSIILLHFVLPAIIAIIIDRFLRRIGKIKGEDYKLDL
jgi:uncharacterized membrane protein